ncbi:complement C5-like isoform X1 [Heterocephalus glaber]|uniref:Complement C5-like isoform X1 n=1 Tax=Heterocephalus glaber TaxID=10181 RepID=A0AAX6PDP3_HETGA|nr:complement C5-like isoform X1 [Heterocephalus glaber]
MGLWRILCFLIFLGKSWGQEQIYVISAPKVFLVGAPENIVIQGYGYSEAFDATISIKHFPNKYFSYSSGYVHLSKENKFQNATVLTIQPKQFPGGQNLLSYVYLEVISKHFSKLKKIPVTSDNEFLFIQTDKPAYIPHESVKVRVYSLNDDSMPAKRETVLTFIDPDGLEFDVVGENDYYGITSFPDFKIPSYPEYGVWTVKASYKEDFSTTGTTYFEIKPHVLPYFFVSIEPESNFIGYKNFKNFEITIKARYFHNQVVTEAQVFVFFGIRQDNGKEMMQKAKQSTKLINGIAQVTFDSETAIKELSYNSLEDLNDKYLYIAVTVVEATGGFSEEAEVPGIKYILSPYTLNLFATPLFLKPGIPYSIKVQVKDSFDQLVGGVPVILNAQTVDVNQETSDLEPRKSVTSLSNGVASFLVYLPSRVMALEFSVKTNVTDLPEENQAGKHYRAIPYSSVSQSYLSIDWTENSKALLVGEYLNITFAAKSPYSHKITHYNYFILSKGKIIQFGTKEKIPGSSYESINIQVTQNMVPSARLLVYYIITGETAELVSDSIVFNIGGKNWTQLQLFHALEKSDLGCGAGGGRDSADVFHRAGLTFITNANVDDSQENDEPCKEILRRKRNLKEKIDEQATKYKYPLLRKCCYDGARHDYESCEKRAERITVGPRCIQAFKECCLLANQIRAEETHKHRYVGGRH